MNQNEPLTDAEINAIEARTSPRLIAGEEYGPSLLDLAMHYRSDVPRLIAEIRRQRAVLDQVDSATLRIDAGLDHLTDSNSKLVAEIDRLRGLIVDYATTPLTFEQLLDAAVGEERAAEIMNQWRDNIQERWNEVFTEEVNP